MYNGIYSMLLFVCPRGYVYICGFGMHRVSLEDKVATLVCHWLDDCGRDIFFHCISFYIFFNMHYSFKSNDILLGR